MVSHDFLSAVSVQTYLLSGAADHCKGDILEGVNKFYSEIVHVLYNAACVTIPQKCNFYKYWWNEELSQLKGKAIESFNLWAALDKP